MDTFISQAVAASCEQKDNSIAEAEQGNQWPKMGKQQVPALLYQLSTGACTQVMPSLLHRVADLLPARHTTMLRQLAMTLRLQSLIRQSIPDRFVPLSLKTRRT